MIKINDTQKTKIYQFIGNFKKYSKSQDYLVDMEDREDRERFFAAISENKFLSMDEFEFEEIISKLWASLIWGNKSYHVERIISENGFENLKKELAGILFHHDRVMENFNHVLENVKYLGPASITELLCYFFPDLCGIWNNKARQALDVLGFSKVLPLNKYKINARDYQLFNQVLSQISDELKKAGFKESNLLFVDYFLYYVCENKSGNVTSETNIIVQTFDHNEVRDFINYIGLWLGFETETEKAIGPGARVDALWRAQIANLGVVNYVFEVHKNGSIDSLIVNLQKSKRNPTVQKVIAVSDSEQIEKIKREMTGLPDEFIRSMAFWEVSDVVSTYNKLSDVFSSIGKLELVKSDLGKL